MIEEMTNEQSQRIEWMIRLNELEVLMDKAEETNNEGMIEKIEARKKELNDKLNGTR